MIRLHLLVIDAALEAQALRSVAEAWGAEVSVTWVANSRQIVEYLGSVAKNFEPRKRRRQ